MARVLITGAAGFIGMHTTIRLIREGWEVVGIDNVNDYYSKSLKEDRLKLIREESAAHNREFLFFRCDLNSEVWQKASKYKYDTVIHLAAQAGVRYSIENPLAYIDSNILGFQAVLEFVRKNSIRSFLYASSSSVYGKDSVIPFNESEPCVNPESYYAFTKKANELMAHSYFKTHGLPSIGLRFFTVYGPWGRPDMAPMLFAKAALKSEKIRVFNHGNQSRDFTYVDDIVEGIMRLILHSKQINGPEIFNIGKGSPTNLMHFISLIEENFNTELKKEYVKAQLGDVENTYSDTTKLVAFTGYKPQISVERGIKEFIRWYREYYELQ